MINLPLNFSAPTGQVQNNYTASTTNPYLTPSIYKGMQLHTPSGYYYQGDKFYEPYTPEPVTYNPNPWNPLNNPWNGNPAQSNGGWGNTLSGNNTIGGPVKDSIQIGNQYFRPFTGDAKGIISGSLSPIGLEPTYQPQGIPNNLLNFLSAPNMQSTNNQGSGASRFLGLLGSPTTTNTQGK
jgi:hypothetical protein